MMKLALSALVVSASFVGLGATGIAQMSQTTSKEHDGRRICRTTQETGKLAARRRTCLTQAQWDRAAEEGRRSGQEWVETLDSCRARGDGGPC